MKKFYYHADGVFSIKWANINLETKLILLITIGTVIVLLGTTLAITSTVTDPERELAYDKSIKTAETYASQFQYGYAIKYDHCAYPC